MKDHPAHDALVALAFACEMYLRNQCEYEEMRLSGALKIANDYLAGRKRQRP